MGPEISGFSHALILVVIFTVESSQKCLYFQENSSVGKRDPELKIIIYMGCLW